MRSLVILLLATSFASLVACAPVDEVDGDVGDSTSSLSEELTGACSISRAKLLATASAARRGVMQRGFVWLDQSVPYSQSASHGGYRTDCSGFVSMCWNLGRSYTTADFISGGGESRALGSYDSLLPGDALVHRSGSSGHIVLFLGWNDAAKSGACVLEQASTASDMQFGVRTASSLRSGGYKAIRADALAGDTTSGSTSPDPATPDPATPAPTTPAPTTPAPTTPAPTTPSPDCTPPSALVLCLAAKLGGVECGFIPDSCGGHVNCDTVFGACQSGEQCGVVAPNRCDPTPSSPPPVVADPASSAADPLVPDDTESQGAGSSSTASSSSARRSRASFSPDQASTGCSASPRGSSGGVAPLLALVVAASLLRRRSRDRRAA